MTGRAKSRLQHVADVVFQEQHRIFVLFESDPGIIDGKAAGNHGTRQPRTLSLPQLGAVVAGNALEFYDFLTFSFFAVQIGQVFFPGKDTTTSLLAAPWPPSASASPPGPWAA